MNPETVPTFFSSATVAFGFILTALLAGVACTISTSSMDDDFDCLLAPVTVSLLSPFLFKKFGMLLQVKYITGLNSVY
jgi:hypothetical protein